MTRIVTFGWPLKIVSLHCTVPGGGQVGDLQGHELRLQRGPADNGPVGLSSHEAVASHGPGASSHSDLHGRPPEVNCGTQYWPGCCTRPKPLG